MIKWMRNNLELLFIAAVSVVMYILLSYQISKTTAAIERIYVTAGADESGAASARATQLFQLMEYQQDGAGMFGTVLLFFVSGLIAAAGLKAVQFIPFVKIWARGEDGELSSKEQITLLISYIALWIALFVTIAGIGLW